MAAVDDLALAPATRQVATDGAAGPETKAPSRTMTAQRTAHLQDPVSGWARLVSTSNRPPPLLILLNPPPPPPLPFDPPPLCRKKIAYAPRELDD